MIFLNGKRLYLRAIEQGDLKRCQRWVNDPELRQFITAVFPLNANGEQRWFDELDMSGNRTNIPLAIVLKKGNRHIGNIGLHGINWVNRRATTGMIIGNVRDRGNGYGPEAKELLLEYAFEQLGLHRIGAGALAINARSIASLKKSGYVEEGRFRDMFFRDGKWIDEILFGLLADDWRARRGK